MRDGSLQNVGVPYHARADVDPERFLETRCEKELTDRARLQNVQRRVEPAGWAFYDLASKALAPKAIVFGKTNPVMVQGAVFAGITITEGWSENSVEVFQTGDTVRVDPRARTVELLKRA